MNDGDGVVDYSTYTREDLLDAYLNIDRESYPKNFANLCRALGVATTAKPATIREMRSPEEKRARQAEALDVKALDREIRSWRRPPPGGTFNRLSFVRDAVSKLPELKDHRPEFDEGITAFGGRIGLAVKVMFSEPETIVFVLLQWVVIGLGYYLWVRMLYWIPENVWRSAEDSNSGSSADYVLLLWSFLCVGLVALPLGVASACIGAVAVLRRSGHVSTIATCLRLVAPQAFRLWVFTWIDAWITVWRILDRLPRKNDHRTWAARMAEEALYYAWKFGTAGVLPALILGRQLGEAGVESIKLLRDRFKEVMQLRTGYSALCWIVGIAAYIGTIVFFWNLPDLIPRHEPLERHVGDFYFWAGVPILIATGIVVVFLRPIYLIALCTLYVEDLKSRGESLEVPPAPSRLVSASVAFLVLAAIVGVAALYRDELGITGWLSIPYGTGHR